MGANWWESDEPAAVAGGALGGALGDVAAKANGDAWWEEDAPQVDAAPQAKSSKLRPFDDPSEIARRERKDRDTRPGLERAFRYVGERLPIVGSVVSGLETADVASAAERIKAGGGSFQDQVTVAKFIQDAQENDKRSLPAEVLDLVSHIPAFATEIAVTGGAYTGARKGVEQLAKKYAGGVVERRAGRIAVGAAARGVGVGAITAANPQHIYRADQEEQLRVALDPDADSKNFLEALPQGFANAYIELGSERAGGAILKATGIRRLQNRMAQNWLRLNPNKTIDDFIRSAQSKTQWHGVIGELGEERVGDLARGVLGEMGMGGMDFGATGGLAQGASGLLTGDAEDIAAGAKAVRQLSAEVAAFSVPGAAAVGARGVSAAADKLSKLRAVRAKGYVSAEDGRAAGIEGETRKERLANADAEIARLEQEVRNAGQVREVEGGPEASEEQVRPEPTGEVAPTPEVPVGRRIGRISEEEAAPKYDAQGRLLSKPVPQLARPEARVETPAGPVEVEAYRGVGRVGGQAVDPRTSGIGGGRFYSPDRSVAESYAGKQGKVVHDRLRFNNPLRAQNWIAAKKSLGIPSATMQELIEEAGKRGYDGIVFERHNGKPEYVNISGEVSPASPPTFVPHPNSAPDNYGEMIQVDVGKVDEAWRGDPSFYLPPEGQGKGKSEILGRREDFQRFLEKGEPIESPQVYLNDDGSVSFNDGRHRFSVLRDQGVREVAINVPVEQAEAVRKLFGVEGTPQATTTPQEAPRPPEARTAAPAVPTPQKAAQGQEPAAPPQKRREVGGGQPPASGLVPTILYEGKLYYGRPGDTHDSLIRQFDEIDVERVVTHPDEFQDAMGFAGPDGQHLDREQALEVARRERPKVDVEEGELEAVDYNMAKAETPPADYSDMAPKELARLLKDRKVPGRTKATTKAARIALLEQHDRETAETTPKPVQQEASQFGQDASVVVGVAAPILTREPGGVGKSVRHFFQKFFTSRGELPAEVYDAKVRRDGRVSKEMNQLRQSAVDFRRATRTALGGKELTQADIERMNAVLRGEAEMSGVPDEVRAPLQAMRDHIDALSRRLVSEGVAQGDLVGIITENEGVYATRSYRVFDDPKWRDKVPDGVRNRAIAAIREMYPEKSDAEVAGMLESLLFRGAADTPVALLKGSKLGSKDLSTFMRRKDVPPWLRDLWGEYKDAGVNYARSVFKMSHLLANHQFLNEVRDAGLGKWLRNQEDGPIVSEYGEVITKLAADESSVMFPLNGLYTTPEIKSAFAEFDSPGAMPDWLRVMMGVNYVVKYGKTVGSVMTHVRNTISNLGFAVANGHWRIDNAGKAVWATATGAFQLSNAEYRAYYNRLAELGVVGEDARAGELKDALRDASHADIDDFLYNSEARQATKIVKAGRAGVRALNTAYQAEDGVWKIYAFENEKARYSKAYPEWSQQQLEERAAEIVRNTYPTYSKISKAVKAVRRFPLVGTFVSFPAEVARTTFHTLNLGLEEMRTPETRSIGAQRIVGTALSLGGLSILSRAMMGMFGIGGDEDDDLRWFVPPWQENSRFLYLAKPKDAKYRFVDLGYSDPHAYLTDASVAFMRGDDWVDGLGKATVEIMRPFASEDILAKTLMDLRSNDDGQIYNPKDEVGEQAKDIIEHLWTKALEPGTISSLRRIRTGAEGTDPSKSVGTEVLAMTTGQRIQTVDVERSLGFRVREFSEALTEIQGIARRTATSRGTATAEMVAADVARMEKLRLAEFSQMQRITGAARRLGVPEDRIRTMLRDELPDTVAEEILTGDYSAYEMTPQTVAQMMQAKPEEFKERFGAWHGENLPDAVRKFAMPKVGSIPIARPKDEDKAAEYDVKIESTKRMLDMLGVSHLEAQKLLLDHYQGNPAGSNNQYEEKRLALGALYDLSKDATRDELLGKSRLAETTEFERWKDQQRPRWREERKKK